MPDERVSALIELGIDPDKAQQSIKNLDAMQKGMQGVQKQAEEAKKKLREMAEAGEKLRNVGAVMAGLGASILAPLTIAATQYADRWKGLEKSANDFVAAQQRSANATATLGREAARALTPVLNQVAAFQEKIASFAQQHPELMKMAVGAGVGLAAGGGALIAAGTAISTIARSAELLKGALGSGVGGGLTQAVVGIGALAAGAKAAEAGLNAVGKATGDERLAHYQLSDALKTARETLGTAVLFLAKAFIEAKKTWGELIDIIEGVFTMFRVQFESAVDNLATGIRKFIIQIQGFVTDLVNKLADMFPQLGIQKQTGKYTTEQQLQGEDEAAAERSFRRGVALKKEGERLAGNAAERDKQYATDQENLQKLAGFVTEFTKSGSLGPLVDGVAKSVGDALSRIVGGTGKGAGVSTGGVSGISPEAVRAFIERNKALAASDVQYRQEQADAKKQFQEGEQKAEREYQDQIGKINDDYMRSELKAADDFRRTEAKETRRANLERLRTIQDMNDRLKDAAASRDIAAFISAQREGEKELKRQQQDADIAAKERLDDYLQQRKEATQQRDYQLQDLKRSFDKDKRERQLAYDEQLAQLRTKHDRERQEIDRSFAEQLADLDGNLGGLKGIRDKYYADETTALVNFVNTNKASLQQLYAGSLGTTAQTASTYTANQLAGMVSGPGSYNTSAANASAMSAYMSSLNLPSFDTGGVVPRDMVALVHKGERITNPANGGGSDNSVNFNAPITVGPGNNVTVDDLKGALGQLATEIRSMTKGPR